MQVDLETVLAVVIALIAVNLIFIGFYIVKVLREISKTFEKARSMIEDVDQSVKDGIGKMAAIERPLQAIATTSVALAGVIKGGSAIRKATESILAASHPDKDSSDDEISDIARVRRPRWFRKSNS